MHFSCSHDVGGFERPILSEALVSLDYRFLWLSGTGSSAIFHRRIVCTYCEAAKHFDYVWFEMQHSTMSYDEVRRMIVACPRAGAAPMLRLPDALESTIQKATDLGALGVIVPTVDDALEARDAARFSRYPPFGRRSAGGGAYLQLWAGLNYRQTINDNMLVTVMIETLEGVANADEIAATHGVDVILIGNNDLSSFSGWNQNDPRYQDDYQSARRRAEIRQVLR